MTTPEHLTLLGFLHARLAEEERSALNRAIPSVRAEILARVHAMQDLLAAYRTTAAEVSRDDRAEQGDEMSNELRAYERGLYKAMKLLGPMYSAHSDFPLVDEYRPAVVKRTEPCRIPIDYGYAPGTACAGCGHVDLVHPGSPNPSLDACAICVLVLAAEGKTDA